PGAGTMLLGMRLLLAMLSCLLLPSLAEGQLRRASGSVMLPPLVVTAPGGAVAVEANPAALSELNGYQLYFLHAGGESVHADEGDVFYAATSLPFGLGLGLGVERLDGDGAGRSGRFSLAGSYAPGRRGAV